MRLFTFAEIRKACGGVFSFPVDPKTTVESVSTDSRVEQKKSLFVALCGEQMDAHDFLHDAVKRGAVLLCVEKEKADRVPPGVPALLVDSTLAAYQSLALFHRKRFPKLKVIGLTGSCGKTSTKEILNAIFSHTFGKAHVLATEGNTNNHVGVPRNLLRLRQEHQYAIIEMGTNHPGEIEPLANMALPNASLIVSIGCCHLEFLGSVEGVAAEKSHIFAPKTVETAVYPQQCSGRDILKAAAAKAKKKLTFGFENDASVQVVYHGGNIEGSSFDLIDTASRKHVTVLWNLPGKHQALNAGGAAAVALSFGLTLEQIAAGVSSIVLPGMRMKRQKHGDALWLNDAYNANPDSMCASLKWLSEFADPGNLILVLGDMAEIGPTSLKEHLRVLSFACDFFPTARIVAVGLRMMEALEVFNSVVKKNIRAFPSAAVAVNGVRSMVRPGDLVFLKGSRSTGMEVIEPEN